MNLRPWILATCCSLSLGGCKKHEAPVSAPQPAPVAAVDASTKSSKLEDHVSVSGKSAPECLGRLELAAPAEVVVGGKKAELNGYRLTFLEEGRDADQTAVFGVLANLNEDSGENLVNLDKYVEFFKAEKVEAILVAGDSGESREAIERGLEPLAQTGMPLFVLAGNRECSGDFQAALSSLQQRHPNVVNLNQVRHVAFDDADLVSLPGYYDRRYIHCPTGCQYFKEDLQALKQIAREAKSPVVLVSHGPPRGSAATAVDRATEAGNVGDPNLNSLILEAGISFGISANIKEAGGRATDLEGNTPVAEGALADELFMNPGAADAVGWAMNDGTQSVGMAAVMRIEGKQASYKVFRAKALTADEKTQAQRLAAGRARGAAEQRSN